MYYVQKGSGDKQVAVAVCDISIKSGPGAGPLHTTLLYTRMTNLRRLISICIVVEGKQNIQHIHTAIFSTHENPQMHLPTGLKSHFQISYYVRVLDLFFNA